MKKYFLSAFILVLFSLTLTNCGGYDDELEISESLSLDKATYAQGQVAHILSTEEYENVTAIIDNDESIDLTKTNNGYAFFISFEMNAGEHEIEITADDDLAYLSFEVIETKKISDPIATIRRFTQKSTSDAENIANAKSVLSGNELISFQRDMDSISARLAGYERQIESLSEAEQQTIAQILSANEESFNELNRAVNKLYTATSKLKKQSIDDFDANLSQVLIDFVKANTALQVDLVVATTATGIAFTGGPLIGAIAGGVLYYAVAQEYKKLEALAVRIASDPVNFVENFFLKEKKSTIEFNKGVFKKLNVTGKYHTLTKD